MHISEMSVNLDNDFAVYTASLITTVTSKTPPMFDIFRLFALSPPDEARDAHDVHTCCSHGSDAQNDTVSRKSFATPENLISFVCIFFNNNDTTLKIGYFVEHDLGYRMMYWMSILDVWMMSKRDLKKMSRFFFVLKIQWVNFDRSLCRYLFIDRVVDD